MSVTCTLWHLQASPPSWAVRMLSDIIGVTLELKEIDFVNKEHKTPEFRKMNPMGTIPVIKDGNFFLPESHTIMKYFLGKYAKGDHKKLYPSTLVEQALVDQVLFFDTGVAFIRVKNIVLPATYSGLSEVTAELAQDCEDVFDITEQYIGEKQWVALPEFTIADISLGSTIEAINSLYALDVKKYPRTAAWLGRLRERPYFQKIAVAGAKRLGAYVQAMFEKNKNQK